MPFLPVENAQHQVLAVRGGQAGDAEIDHPAGHGRRDAAVLRRARLGDVHLRHHLDAHRHRRPVGLVQRADLAQHAVDPVADAQEVLLGLEVDIGAAALDRVGEQRRDQAHHRLRVLVALGDGGVVDLAGLDLLQDAVDRELVAVVVLDRALDLRLAGQAQLDLVLALEVRAQLVDRDDVVGVGERDHELALAAVERHREHAVAARHLARQLLERRRVDDDAREVHRLQSRASRTAHRAASLRTRSRAAPAACRPGCAAWSARAARCAAGPRSGSPGRSGSGRDGASPAAEPAGSSGDDKRAVHRLAVNYCASCATRVSAPARSKRAPRALASAMARW